jgi:uncharacterized protein DUF6158
VRSGAGPTAAGADSARAHSGGRGAADKPDEPPEETTISGFDAGYRTALRQAPTNSEGMGMSFDVPDEEPAETGVPAADLPDDDLLRELEQLHRTRHETFLHAPTQALQHHSERTAELELEYLRRHPERDIDESRLRDRARERT